MWEQLKKEIFDLAKCLPFVEYFLNLEKRIYQMELTLYKAHLSDTIEGMMSRYQDMELKDCYFIKETPIVLDSKYEKDYEYLCTIMKVKYQDNESFSVTSEVRDHYGAILLKYLGKKKAPRKKKSTPLRKVKGTVGILIILGLISCTNATMKQYTSLGNPGLIRCYSGGQLIYEGESTGKIGSEQQSDGWYFEEKGTNQLVRVSGDCVIRN